jgi:hypothetical protein
MDRHMGLDARASTCTLGVMGPSGKRLSSQVVETNARALIEVVRAVPGKRHLCTEEGALAEWLCEVLEPDAFNRSRLRTVLGVVPTSTARGKHGSPEGLGGERHPDRDPGPRFPHRTSGACSGARDGQVDAGLTLVLDLQVSRAS